MPGSTLLDMSGSITTVGTGTSVDLEAIGVAPFDITNSIIRLTLAIDNVQNVSILTFFVGTGSGSFTSYIRWRFTTATGASRLAKSGECFTVELALSDIDAVDGTAITLSTTGMPSNTGPFNKATLRATDDAGGAGFTVDLLSVEVIQSVPGAYASITFDDSDESLASRAFPKMASLGLKGTAYTIVERLGNAGFTTMDWLKALAAAGWEIGGHAYTQAVHQAGYTGVDGVTAQADLVNLRNWLVTNFADSDGIYSFAYPHGYYEDTTDGYAVDAMVAQIGFNNARTILSDTGVLSHVQSATLAPAMPQRLNATEILSGQQTGSPASAAGLVASGGVLDKLEANGGYLIIAFHRVLADGVTPSAAEDVTLADFETVVESLAERDITVLPVRDVLGPTFNLGCARVPTVHVPRQLETRQIT